jgi:hypothetical protein
LTKVFKGLRAAAGKTVAENLAKLMSMGVTGIQRMENSWRDLGFILGISSLLHLVRLKALKDDIVILGVQVSPRADIMWRVATCRTITSDTAEVMVCAKGKALKRLFLRSVQKLGLDRSL